MATRKAPRGLKCPAGASDDVSVKQRDETPGLYGEAELRAAVQRDSYGIEVSEEEREESADPSGAISLPSGDSDAESLRICLVADTLGHE